MNFKYNGKNLAVYNCEFLDNFLNKVLWLENYLN
jgi:hypothetical protein